MCSPQSCDSIVTDAEAITPDEDIRVACETCGTGPNQPEQLLYDCYVRILYTRPCGVGNILSHSVTSVAGTRYEQFH